MKLREIISVFIVAGTILAACFGVDLFQGNLKDKGNQITPDANTSYLTAR